MRRRVAAMLAVGLAAVLAFAPAALAHPLGNFSINHLTRIKVSSDRIELRYILDQAEIPTFQERGLSDAAILARKRSEVVRRLLLTVNGRRVPFRFEPGPKLTFPPGQGGLKLTRVEFGLVALVRRPRRVALDDGTFPGRIGWKAIVAQPGKGTAVRSSAPSGDPTHGLRTYPVAMLSSPLAERTAALSVKPGDGTLTAPRYAGGSDATTSNRSGDGFAGIFASAAAGQGVLIFLLLAAFGWGALHALSPGHGKAMVAAYLVGTRGTARHAVALGVTVTITHTIGVFALGLVTLLLSQYVLPEQLYPWLTLASGLLVLGIGGQVLRSRVRVWRRARASAASGLVVHQHGETDHAHGHAHDHSHGHGDGHAHSHGHGHGHSHDLPENITWRGLITMGASAGLIPCPSALVVLIGAIAQHQVALGLLLIVLFSLGLATTLTALGLAVVSAKRLTARVSFSSPIAAALPTLSAVVIMAAGALLTVRAIPNL